MNFLWINLECCTLKNYIIASIVKIVLYNITYIIPLVLIVYSMIKFFNKKNKQKKKKKLIILIIVAILSFAFGITTFNILEINAEVTETSKQTWSDCYSGICQMK